MDRELHSAGDAGQKHIPSEVNALRNCAKKKSRPEWLVRKCQSPVTPTWLDKEPIFLRGDGLFSLFANALRQLSSLPFVSVAAKLSIQPCRFTMKSTHTGT